MATICTFILGGCLGLLGGMMLQREKDEELARTAYERGRRKEMSERFGDQIKHRAEMDELKAANEYLRTRNWNRRCTEIVK